MKQLKNSIVEKILCERYAKSHKGCICEENGEQQQPESKDLDIDLSDILTNIVMGKAALSVPIELIKAFFTPVKKLEVDEPAVASTQMVPGVQDPNRMKTPRMSRVKDFGISSGSVISPG
jgi:hypothetical protein